MSHWAELLDASPLDGESGDASSSFGTRLAPPRSGGASGGKGAARVPDNARRVGGASTIQFGHAEGFPPFTSEVEVADGGAAADGGQPPQPYGATWVN